MPSTQPLRVWRPPLRVRVLTSASSAGMIAVVCASFAMLGMEASIPWWLCGFLAVQTAFLQWRPRVRLWPDRIDVRAGVRTQAISLFEVADVQTCRRGLVVVRTDGRPSLVSMWGDVGMLTRRPARALAAVALAAEVMAAVREARNAVSAPSA